MKQAPRIIGQCNAAAFKEIEHLAVTLEHPEYFDASTLSRKHKLAFLAMAALLKCKFKTKDILKIREILFWSDGHIEFKFMNVPGAREMLLKLQQPAIRAAFGRGLDSMLPE